MIKFVAKRAGGGKLVGFGLSAENVKRLQAGKPIMVHGEDMGLEGLSFTILAGETEEVIAQDLQAAGFTWPGQEKPH